MSVTWWYRGVDVSAPVLRLQVTSADNASDRMEHMSVSCDTTTAAAAAASEPRLPPLPPPPTSSSSAAVAAAGAGSRPCVFTTSSHRVRALGCSRRRSLTRLALCGDPLRMPVEYQCPETRNLICSSSSSTGQCRMSALAGRRCFRCTRTARAPQDIDTTAIPIKTDRKSVV